MAAGWIEAKRRADTFNPEIKRILGEHLIRTSDIVQDETEATDMLVLELRPFRIGCRVRKYDYFLRYPNEITIRAERLSGFRSEMTKIVEGWLDYLFYGFADPTDSRLLAWTIASLPVWRATLIRKPTLIGSHYLRQNGDLSSTFYAWPLDCFPQNFVIARHLPDTHLPTPCRVCGHQEFRHDGACGWFCMRCFPQAEEIP